jgi:3-methylcrotonyl-CoA carboxylase alpha subunit
VLIEKWIEKPRHIEVQVFGDGTRALHLFERDCSLQRRHQKVIEEAPAPGMTEEVRAAMGAAAVRAAEAIGYSGAGTVEFIVDGSRGLRTDGFWFMEMNTRLQVEHPVTEAITGVDLVEWQLRVAAGEALPCRQADLAIRGHAFEARLYAEDVPAGFLPATGRLDHLAFPEGARVDTGVRPGDAISPWYDPMIAKVVTHGPTRAVALARLRAALAGTEVAGSVTNLDFLSALAAHEGFNAGEVDTGLIGRDLESWSPNPRSAAQVLALAALAAQGFDDAAGAAERLRALVAAVADGGVAARRGVHPVAVARRPTGPSASGWAGQEMRAEWRGGRWWIDGQAAPGRAVRPAGRVTVFGAPTVGFTLPDPLAVEAAAGAGAGVVTAPMPGLVKAVFVKPGAAVEKGARLAVLEAMKMEHTLAAGRDGVVAERCRPRGGCRRWRSTGGCCTRAGRSPSISAPRGGCSGGARAMRIGSTGCNGCISRRRSVSIWRP